MSLSLLERSTQQKNTTFGPLALQSLANKLFALQVANPGLIFGTPSLPGVIPEYLSLEPRVNSEN